MSDVPAGTPDLPQEAPGIVVPLGRPRPTGKPREGAPGRSEEPRFLPTFDGVPLLSLRTAGIIGTRAAFPGLPETSGDGTPLDPETTFLEGVIVKRPPAATDDDAPQGPHVWIHVTREIRNGLPYVGPDRIRGYAIAIALPISPERQPDQDTSPRDENIS